MPTDEAKGSTPPADVTGSKPILRRAGRNRTKADVLLYESARGRIAVKDYSSRPWWIRNTLGRFLVRRETKVYGFVNGVAGIPRFAGRLGPFSMAVAWIDARPLAEFDDGALPAALFDRVREIVLALHERGIALADLNHRDILVSDNGSVHLIDLATAWILGERPGPIRRRLFDRFRAADLFAVARLRARFVGEDADAVVSSTDPTVLAWHRRARRIKWTWDRVRGAKRLPPVKDHWRP
jgi:hypothetical protein